MLKRHFCNSDPTEKNCWHINTSRKNCWYINSLVPGKFEWNFRYLIFQIISVIDGWGISCELALRRMSLDLTDDKSTLVQVLAWCRQATSHYLSQCWPRSMSPYGFTRPQWVNTSRKNCWHNNTLRLRQNGDHFAEDIFKCIILNIVWISIFISLNFVIFIYIKSALVQIMAWCWVGDKTLSETLMDYFTDAYMWYAQWISRSPPEIGIFQNN